MSRPGKSRTVSRRHVLQSATSAVAVAAAMPQLAHARPANTARPNAEAYLRDLRAASPERFFDCAAGAGLVRDDVLTFGHDYARTLAHWDRAVHDRTKSE